MMAAENQQNQYFVLDSGSPDMMLFYSLPDPGLEDDWLGGQRFEEQPDVPVKVVIKKDNEDGELLDYHNTVNLMSDALAETLRNAGVDNVDFYDAVIAEESGRIRHRGYKVFNLVGVIRAADLTKTVFIESNPSRVIDASIATLALDEGKIQGALMFRLAENVSVVVVHARIAEAIRAGNFRGVKLREIDEVVKP